MHMQIHRKLTDIENIQYLLVIHKASDLAFFSYAFTDIPIEANLISGFLSAINIFGQTLGPKMENAVNIGPRDSKGLQEVTYEGFKIMLIDGYLIRTAVLLRKSANPTFQEKVHNFTDLLESQYQPMLEVWDGSIPDATPILNLAEQTMNIDLLYLQLLIPDKIIPYLKTIPKRSTRALIIREVQTPNFNNSFRMREMIDWMRDLNVKENDTIDALHQLR